MSDVVVLCYHGVSASWDASISVTPDALERQLHDLTRRGYRGATFRQAVTDPPWSRTVAVTFDDAYRSVLEQAFPVLSALGVVGSVYVPSDFAGNDEPMCWPGIEQWIGGPHEPELMPLAWSELGTLTEAGWEVGSHTCSHPMLTGLDDRRLAAELADSRAAIERELGGRCDSIAYPYGDMDDRVIHAAARAGYRVGGAIASTRPASRLDWPRIGIYHRDPHWRFRLKVSPLVRRLRVHGRPLGPPADEAQPRKGG